MKFSYGYDKEYKCPKCNKSYERDEVVNSDWKCPECNVYIWIAAPELRSGHIKIRKKAKDIKKMDGIHLRGTNEIYIAVGITPLNNSKLRIGLKNYGSIDVDKDEFIDIIEGAYNEESWNK